MDQQPQYIPDKQFYTTGDIAKLFGVGTWVINHLVATGEVVEPPRISGRRVFPPTHLALFKQAFDRRQGRVEDRANKVKTRDGHVGKLPSNLVVLPVTSTQAVAPEVPAVVADEGVVKLATAGAGQPPVV